MSFVSPEYVAPTSMLVGTEISTLSQLMSYEVAVEKKFPWFAFEILSLDW